MNKKRCCFAGHSDVYNDEIRKRIKETAEMLIRDFDVKEFWVGNYGGFDGYATSAIQELKQLYHIIKANEYMVKSSDFLICYVNHSWGGAARTFEYAKRKKY